MSGESGASLLRSEFAPAKVNLTLLVTGRRSDGYHLLDSLAVFPAIGDTIAAALADTLSLRIEGPFARALAPGPENLVLRAAHALASARGVTAGAALTLTKRLPVASGIGGGSADAAAALRLLARLWKVAPADAALAATLGADVPVCLASAPARMRGIGDVLSPAPVMPDCGMVLVNPGVPVATPAVFRARAGGFSPDAVVPPAWADFPAMAAGLANLGNDLQAPAIALCPVIAEVLTALASSPGCALARMSGSGATCFGLYADAAAAASAAAMLQRPGWWCWGGLVPR